MSNLHPAAHAALLMLASMTVLAATGLATAAADRPA